MSVPLHVDNWLDLIGSLWSQADVQVAKRRAADGLDPAGWLLSRGLDLDVLLEVLSTFYEVPSVDVSQYSPQAEAVNLVPHELARRFCMLPLFRSHQQVYVATPDPLDLEALDFVRKSLGVSVIPVVAVRSAIEEAIDRHYASLWKAPEHSTVASPGLEPEDDVELNFSVLEDEQAPAIKLVNYVIAHGIRLGASDVHLKPGRERTFLRYRVDGVLHDFPPPPLNLFRSLVTRLKVMSNLDVAERRLPQDGRARLDVDNRSYDLRVSIIPNRHDSVCV